MDYSKSDFFFTTKSLIVKFKCTIHLIFCQEPRNYFLNWRTELWRIIINKENDWMLGEILVEAGYCFLLCVITVLSKL